MKIIRPSNSFAALLIVSAGCAPHPLTDGWPEARPLGSDLHTHWPPEEPPDDRVIGTVFEQPSGTLTLRQSLAAALENNPELAVFSWDIRVGDARILQARLLPNPEVGLEVENFGGTGEASGFDSAETTVLLSQLIPLARKIEKRTRVAELSRDLAGWDYEAKRIEVFTQVVESFVSVAVAQRRLELAGENVALADKVYLAASNRVKAGAAATIEKTKASVVVARTQIELQRAQRELTAARHRLAATWGSMNPVFKSVVAELETIQPVPPYEDVMMQVSQNPDLARWAVQIAQRKAEVELAKAQAIPDITAGAGVRRGNEVDDTVYVLEFSLPIPLFDQNQGGILEARYAAAKAEQQRRAVQVRVRTVLAEAYQTLAAVFDEATSLRDKVLPAARQAFDATNRGYQEGKESYLEVLDAQRTLIEAEAQYVEALGGYHSAVAEIEGLIGQPLSALFKRLCQDKREISVHAAGSVGRKSQVGICTSAPSLSTFDRPGPEHAPCASGISLWPRLPYCFRAQWTTTC